MKKKTKKISQTATAAVYRDNTTIGKRRKKQKGKAVHASTHGLAHAGTLARCMRAARAHATKRQIVQSNANKSSDHQYTNFKDKTNPMMRHLDVR